MDSARGIIRVVHVAGQLATGGMEKLLVEFARHGDRARFDLHFVALTGCGPVADEIRALGWPVTELNVKPGFHPTLYVRLARLFRRLGADVVHTHNTRPVLFAAPAARLARVKRVIHTRHGQRFGAKPRETKAFRWATKTVDRMVCVSHDSARLTEAEGVNPARIVTVWNGIDVNRFRRAAPEGAGPMIAVGRLSPEKDFPTLVRAAALAAEREPTFRLEIAGGGACADEIRQMIAELRAEGVVTLLGPVSDVPSLLTRGSGFTLASLTEGISLTILEAMASGLPVVATRVGGNPEVVAHGETGLLVEPGDPRALAESLLTLWRDPSRRRKMGDAGRARVEARFDVRAMVAAYESLYLEGLPHEARNAEPDGTRT
jgi:sugar transferase (PEP-CTERM/EpsH1 system associated)